MPRIGLGSGVWSPTDQGYCFLPALLCIFISSSNSTADGEYRIENKEKYSISIGLPLGEGPEKRLAFWKDADASFLFLTPKIIYQLSH